MNSAFPGSRTDIDSNATAQLGIPDANDVPVVLAALAAKADAIVTQNIRDFPASALRPLGLAVQTPDEFLVNQLTLSPDAVARALKKQSRRTSRPAMNIREILERLERCGTSHFAQLAKQLIL